jgi:hypothetical protein
MFGRAMQNCFISGCFGFASFGSIRVTKPKTEPEEIKIFIIVKVLQNLYKNNRKTNLAKIVMKILECIVSNYSNGIILGLHLFIAKIFKAFKIT